MTISRHTLAAVNTPCSWRERLSHCQSRLLPPVTHVSRDKPGCRRLINAIAQWIIRPQISRNGSCQEKNGQEARLAAVMVARRSRAPFGPKEALETIMSNSEGARLPTPPRHRRSSFARDSTYASGADIVASAMRESPTVLIRSERMDWWQSVVPSLLWVPSTNLAISQMWRPEGVRVA
jgi:hypothetical protein